MALLELPVTSLSFPSPECRRAVAQLGGFGDRRQSVAEVAEHEVQLREMRAADRVAQVAAVDLQ
jgi:hypothetical protein